jgi:hypothetical protein
MSNFSRGFQSFLEGFDWKLILAYWRGIREHAWEIFWGSGVLGIIFTIYTLYYAPARPYIPWVVVWVVLVAGYYIWRADHLRLEKVFDIRAVKFQWWWAEEAGVPEEKGQYAWSYYLEIVNRSDTASIEEAEAQLAEIVPSVENFDWLPVHLRHKHDHSFQGEKIFTLHPGQVKLMDFVSALENEKVFTVLHIVGGVTNKVPANERHRLKVIVTGKDVPALSKWFDVWIDRDGILQCEMERTNQAIIRPNHRNSTL